MEAGEVLAEPATSKKTSKKQSKNTSTPSRPKVPAAPDASKGPVKQSRYKRHSGLWECYYDGQTEEGGGEGERGKEGESKNIRGFLLKRRKSPLKGWHKRYFVLEGGILCYGRSYAHIQKGKILGSIDLGLVFINCDGNTRRIDIDGEHQVYHLKTKNASHFAAWSSCLLSQEMFRKAQLAGGAGMEHSEGGVAQTKGEGVEGWAVKTQETIASVKKDLDTVRDSLEVMSILVKSPLTARPVSTQLSATELKVPEGSNNSESSSLYPTQSSSDSGSGKKSRKSKRKAEKKSKEPSVTLSPDQVTQAIPSLSPSLSSSQLDDPTETSSPRDDFGSLANTVFYQFCDLVEKLEKLDEDLQEVIKRDSTHHIRQQTIITNQQILLRKAEVQNSELRDRLTQIQSLAAGVEPAVRMVTPSQRRATPGRAFHTGSIPRFDSFLSVHSTISDTFFDALEDLHELSTESEDEVENSETSAGEEEEEEDEELFTSLTTEVLSTLNMTLASPKQTRLPSISESPNQPSELGVKRRTKLPCPVVDIGDFSLWSFLRKNIGKDLSKVSMPVTLNEPLSALQRLCEELQYSELLDEAAGLSDVHDRMVRVAAFAVSSYALAYYRAGRKPFNPILGETYEWIREDKGFKFIAEQVSHHPPIAACNCESPNYCFWQDARIKNKFWGKSMEVFPIGTVNVTLPKHGDHYQWKKVTSCIHNVLGGQRWVDQYGELHITNQDKCSCKLTFIKASYWSSKKYEVHGNVYDSDGQKVRHLFGTWHEAMFCGDPANAECIWRAAPMPVDHEQYYGFSQYAIGLNDLEEGMREKLPCTDSRFRPDQRLVEEGRIQEAEAEKHRVEQIQREARAERERVGEDWTPNFFRKEEKDEEECWVFMGNYWTHRDNGFTDLKLPKLW